MILSAIVVFGLLALSDARPNTVGPTNVVVVPPNCPTGQVWLNGQCRDVWRMTPIVLAKPLIPTPESIDNASWEYKQAEQTPNVASDDIEPTGIITVPNQCPIGYRPDAHGICREIF